MSETPAPASVGCGYPQSHATAHPVADELAALVPLGRNACSSFFLDTKEEHRNPFWTEGEDHHQGLARSHRLSNGEVYFFLTHSEMDDGDQGQLMQFRYGGPLDDEHVVETHPLTVAPLVQQLYLEERHPCDVQFMPDVNGADSGYLFVAESHDKHRVCVYAWSPDTDLVPLGTLPQGFPSDSPDWIFVDRVEGTYFLGAAGAGVGRLFTAPASSLFPTCQPGELDLTAFRPASPESLFLMPAMDGASQVKLVRDSTEQWYLLGFRSDPDDDPTGTDYVDVYGVTFSPHFAISPRLSSTHVSFTSGDTGFASTGTCHVEPSGRLLLASSWRWSDASGPGDSGYASQVDECPSA